MTDEPIVPDEEEDAESTEQEDSKLAEQEDARLAGQETARLSGQEEAKAAEQTKRMERLAQPEAPGESGKARARRALPFGYLLLWLMVSISLILNAVMLRQVILARDLARQAVVDASAVIENLQSQEFAYTVVIDEMLPVRTDVPLDMTIPVVINETIAIATTVTVPVDTVVFGVIPVRVPFSTAIPVNFEQEIVIDETLTIDTIVPVYIEVPIDLKVRDTPLLEMLNDLNLRLDAMERSLSVPLIPFLGR